MNGRMETRLAKLERTRHGGDLSLLADEVLDARIDRIAMLSGDKGYAKDWSAAKAAGTSAALGVFIAKVRSDVHAGA